VADPPKPGALERIVQRDRAVTAAGLVVLCGLAWLYVFGGAGLGLSPAETMVGSMPRTAGAEGPMALMPGMDMAGAASPGSWSPARWTLVVAMWATMMVAMMTPAAAPTILLYGRVQRHAAAAARGGPVAPTWCFLVGYLLAWTAFSGFAAVLQWALERSGLLSASLMASQSRWLSAGILAAAGLYQLSPLQRRCLSHCRAPAAFLARHWRPGLFGAARLGVLHGAYCVGCCWLLMALLFVGGAMNLVWIAALATLVLAEKLLPAGRRIGTATGVALLLWAAATLAG
jgi:predicted metal-binding membrane protein